MELIITQRWKTKSHKLITRSSDSVHLSPGTKLDIKRTQTYRHPALQIPHNKERMQLLTYDIDEKENHMIHVFDIDSLHFNLGAKVVQS